MAQESWNREEEAAGCQLPEGPILCANNCGFFGSVATMNLCSQCFRLHQSKISMSPTPSPPPPPPPPPPAPITPDQFDLGGGGGGVGVVESLTTTTTITLPPKDDHHQLGKVDDVLPPPSTSPPPPGENVTAANHTLVNSSTVKLPSSGLTEVCPTPPQRTVANRCNACRKRVGLTGFKCRCGDVFCSMHRYSDKHNCSFDYKTAGRLAIAKANPVIKADKVGKI